jgi:hypothetical protein
MKQDFQKLSRRKIRFSIGHLISIIRQSILEQNQAIRKTNITLLLKTLA